MLLPVWSRVRAYVHPPRPPASAGTRPLPRIVPIPDRTDGIRPIDKAEFDRLAQRFPYYRGRWGYMSVATRIAGELIEQHRLTSALELGPNVRSLIVGADVMDIRVRPELEADARVIEHDARHSPWPAGDKDYGLFVALQVFEHLKGDQNRAFLEAARIARTAIVSLPIDWEMDDPRNCHHRISNEMALSWFQPFAPTRVEVGNGGPRKRLVYVFEDLEAAPVQPGDRINRGEVA